MEDQSFFLLWQQPTSASSVGFSLHNQNLFSDSRTNGNALHGWALAAAAADLNGHLLPEISAPIDYM